MAFRFDSFAVAKTADKARDEIACRAKCLCCARRPPRIFPITELFSLPPIGPLAAWLVPSSAGGLHGLDASS
jgi:hypothetical protein